MASNYPLSFSLNYYLNFASNLASISNYFSFRSRSFILISDKAKTNSSSFLSFAFLSYRSYYPKVELYFQEVSLSFSAVKSVFISWARLGPKTCCRTLAAFCSWHNSDHPWTELLHLAYVPSPL